MRCIDVHAHFSGRACMGKDRSEREEVRLINDLLEQFEIEKCVVSATLAILYDFREGNALTARLVERESAWYGYITVNPNYPEASLAEIEKYAEHRKFIGIKNWPINTREPIDSTSNLGIIESVQRKGYHLPILLHTYGEADGRAVLNAAKKFPEQIIIMGHMGGPQWHKIMPLLAEAGDACRNVHVEPCCSHPNADKIRCARDRIGISRVLFGTDLPIISPALTLGMVEGADLPRDEKQRLLYDNAVRLFRFDE